MRERPRQQHILRQGVRESVNPSPLSDFQNIFLCTLIEEVMQMPIMNLLTIVYTAGMMIPVL